MKRIILLTALLTLAFGSTVGAPPALAANSVATLKNFIKINAVKYRRADAESAAIGSIGEKRSPVGKVPRFYKQFPWRSGSIKIKQVSTITLTSSQKNELGGEAQTVTETGTTVSASGKGGGSVDAKYRLLKLRLKPWKSVVWIRV